MNGITELGPGWLFLSAFTSATLLPGSSEVLLGAMAAKGEWSMASLLLWATLGNTLGSMTTWWLGWLATFKKKPEEFSRQWGTKSPRLAQTTWPLVSAAGLDAGDRRWSLSAGRLAAPLLLALSHSHRARQIVALCPGLSAGQADLLASLTR